MSNAQETASDKIHKFEKAGLGKAPFRLVGNYRSVYVACPGAPIQPGTCCDYCAQGITDVYAIRSSDGKEFKVGSTCVYKTGDKALVSDVKRAANNLEREKRREREAQRIAEGLELLNADESQAVLAQAPHPNSKMAAKGATFLDYVEWMFCHSGNAGKLAVIKQSKSILAK